MADGTWHRIETLHHAQLYAPQEGDIHGAKVKGLRLCLVFHQDSWHALEGRCPHAGAPLCGGHLEEGSIICPWHRLAFDIQTGACRNGGYFVKTYPVKKEKGELWVNLPRKKLWGIF